MEALPSFFVAFNVCAATFPRFASALGVAWLGARVTYQLGYEKKGPKGRRRSSSLSFLGLFTLVLSLTWGC
jgi:MAPEG family